MCPIYPMLPYILMRDAPPPVGAWNRGRPGSGLWPARPAPRRTRENTCPHRFQVACLICRHSSEMDAVSLLNANYAVWCLNKCWLCVDKYKHKLRSSLKQGVHAVEVRTYTLFFVKCSCFEMRYDRSAGFNVILITFACFRIVLYIVENL